MPTGDVWQAVLCPEPLMSDREGLSPEDVQIAVFLRKLRRVGIADGELYGLCVALRGEGTGAEAEARLRRIRCRLMENLHQRQKVLDDLDNYADAIRKARASEGERKKEVIH